MTVHYHGLPLTPTVMALDLAGRNVCISYATKINSQVEMCLELMQSIMFDNGAFSFYRDGRELDLNGYYDWIEPNLGHPHWAVVPDVIDGTVEQQRNLLKTWPYSKNLGAAVWHLGLPLDYLKELADEWPRICLGSSGEYWDIGSSKWKRRMDEASNVIQGMYNPPWVHGLRMLNQAPKYGWLASADSVNVSRNYKRNLQMPGQMALRIDQTNGRTGPALRMVKSECPN